MNATKGEKRLLPNEAFKDAARVKIKRSRNWSPDERLRLAAECRDKLAAYPALTRQALARQLDITTARLNQLLSLL